MSSVIGQLNVMYILKSLIVTSSLAQLVESLTLTSDFAGSRPVGVTYLFFMQIIFLNQYNLLLVCISEVFEFKHVFSFFYQLYKSGQMQLSYHKLIYNIEYAYVTILKI